MGEVEPAIPIQHRTLVWLWNHLTIILSKTKIIGAGFLRPRQWRRGLKTKAALQYHSSGSSTNIKFPEAQDSQWPPEYSVRLCFPNCLWCHQCCMYFSLLKSNFLMGSLLRKFMHSAMSLKTTWYCQTRRHIRLCMRWSSATSWRKCEG